MIGIEKYYFQAGSQDHRFFWRYMNAVIPFDKHVSRNLNSMDRTEPVTSNGGRRMALHILSTLSSLQNVF